jgi:hypothetical protein
MMCQGTVRFSEFFILTLPLLFFTPFCSPSPLFLLPLQLLRPIKGIAVENITKTQKSEDKLMYMTSDKWLGLAKESIQAIPAQIPSAKEISVALKYVPKIMAIYDFF